VFLEIISMGRCGDREIKKMQASMTDQKSAFATVLAIQSMLMQRFEEQIPDSNLTKRFAANPNSPGRSGSDWRCSDLLGAQGDRYRDPSSYCRRPNPARTAKEVGWRF